MSKFIKLTPVYGVKRGITGCVINPEHITSLRVSLNGDGMYLGTYVNLIGNVQHFVDESIDEILKLIDSSKENSKE